MDLIFNELSIQPLAVDKTEGFNRVTSFLETFKKASEKGYNKIRFDVPNKFTDILSGVSITDDQTLADYRSTLLKDLSNKRYGQLLMGLPKKPFIDENTEEENKYIQNSFILLKDGTNVEPFGLAAAYLYSTAAIGFCSESFWENCQFELIIKGECESAESIFCASKPEHFSNNKFLDFIERNKPINLKETDIDPELKPISLRDDHGKDVLNEFSKRLRKSKYVLSIVNSLPYNSFSNNFIKKVYPNGNIEIVLTKTDKGLGLVVKTTGANLRETEEISKILEEKYNV